MKKYFSLIIYYFLSIMYFEIFHKYLIYHMIFDSGLFYTCILSFLIAIILTFISRLGKNNFNKSIVCVIMLFLTIIFIGSYIYYAIFSVPFTFQITSMTGQALEFLDVLWAAIRSNLICIFLFFLPFLYFLKIQNKIMITKIYFFEKKILIGLGIFTYLFMILMLLPFKNTDASAFRLYWKQNNLSVAIKTLGLLTAERLDLQRALFGFEEKIEINKNEVQEMDSSNYNMIDINFDELISNESNSSIKSLYSYFQNEIPTKKNEYTGVFEGKNLIFILAESFNSIAVSKELTPTLYKLTHSGFQFNHFYSPVFLSTTGGEFQSMTGLVPSTETLNEWYKGEVSLPYAIGNSLGNLNYNRFAFHNYENTFYNRDKTMPTLGFDNFKACNSGLENLMNCNWDDYSNAPDDNEMIKQTFKFYAKKSPFVVNYITMSGHFPYDFSKKTRNYELVKNLPYSDKVKAYLATQIDLDKALSTLINNLNKEGILDDTVICLVGDHYPYALTIEEVNEVSKFERDERISIHESNLIIWNNGFKTVEVDKVGSQIDILPTLLNLFGIEYDARLMIGRDILSNTEGLAIFADMSWVSDSGTYNAMTKTFTPKKEVKDNYVSEMNHWVNNSVIVSKKIITNDIYRKIFKK